MELPAKKVPFLRVAQDRLLLNDQTSGQSKTTVRNHLQMLLELRVSISKDASCCYRQSRSIITSIELEGVEDGLDRLDS